jgi:hypothetical protein
MPAPREGDLPTFVYHHFTVSLPTSSPAIVQGTPISFARTPVILPTTPVFGTTEFDVAAGGGDMTLSLNGIAQVTTGGAFAIGDPITFDTTSRATLAAAGNQIFGRALDASTAAGSKARVLITREGAT